jgi:hypothetical protein
MFRRQQTIRFERIDRGGTSFAHGGHPAIPGSRRRCVAGVFQGKQDPGNGVYLGDVVPPRIDIGRKPFCAWFGGAAGGKPGVDILHMIDIERGCDQQVGARGEMQVERLAADACPFGDVRHAQAGFGIVCHERQHGLENARTGVRFMSWHSVKYFLLVILSIDTVSSWYA